MLLSCRRHHSQLIRPEVSTERIADKEAMICRRICIKLSSCARRERAGRGSFLVTSHRTKAAAKLSTGHARSRRTEVEYLLPLDDLSDRCPHARRVAVIFTRSGTGRGGSSPGVCFETCFRTYGRSSHHASPPRRRRVLRFTPVLRLLANTAHKKRTSRALRRIGA